MEGSTTLQQGLNAFRKKNKQTFSEQSISKEGKYFLQSHDIAHIVFGCDTSIYGEGLVKIWTTFGTTLSFCEVLKGYNKAEAFKLSRMYSFRHVIKNILRLLLMIPKTIYHAKKMAKPWPFKNYKAYLDMPISKIRTEFNIQII